MARYIDAKQIRYCWMYDADGKEHDGVTLQSVIDKVPTADVAPRAEVAREIFDEIEKIIEKHHSECYEYEDGDECDTAITYISYLSVDIAELKKKYQ